MLASHKLRLEHINNGGNCGTFWENRERRPRLPDVQGKGVGEDSCLCVWCVVLWLFIS